MPKHELPIPETDTLITRKVAIEVIQDVLINRMGLSSAVPISFPGFAETVAQPRGLISNKTEDPRWPTTSKLLISVTENYIEEWLPAVRTTQPEQIPSFLNRDLEVELRPIYAMMEMRIAIQYRAENKTLARRFYDFMMTKIPDRQDTWMHKIHYSYGIPGVFMKILEEIHRLTELQAGYGDDFDDFFNKWVNPRYGMITDQVGKNDYGVFSETQDEVIGFFDVGTSPDFGGKKDETDVWEIEIPYVIRYEKPKDMYMGYPIVIHNSVLSSKYRGETVMERTEDYAQSRPKSLAMMKAVGGAFKAGRNYSDFPGRYFPLFDNFIPRNITPNTMRVFTALVTLADDDADDPLLLMNLKDLEDPGFGFVFNDCVKQYLTDNHAMVTKPRHAAINVSLYMGRLLMDDAFIEMDADLNVRLTRPMNKRKYYHVRVSIVTDLTYMTEPANLELRKNPCMLRNLIEYIMPDGTLMPKLEVSNDTVKYDNYEMISDWIKGVRRSGGTKTVQTTKMKALFSSTK